MNPKKVIVIGCGNVGMSYCYALLNQETKIDELYLIDLDKERVKGEVMDLNHALPFAPSKFKIKTGTYEDCKDANQIIIAAGASQKPGETRLDLVEKNYKIFKSIITKVMQHEFDGIFLVATNPVDIMTYATYKISGLPSNQVIGSGTILDTARLKYRISEKTNINSRNVHAYVIGEHGDSEVIPWSIADIGLESITNYLNEQDMQEIANEVKNDAYEIIKRKGSTHFGIGMCLVKITNAICYNTNSILTISSYDKENDIYISTPTILNKEGAHKKIKLALNEKEELEYQNSIKIIKKEINKIEEIK